MQKVLCLKQSFFQSFVQVNVLIKITYNNTPISPKKMIHPIPSRMVIIPILITTLIIKSASRKIIQNPQPTFFIFISSRNDRRAAGVRYTYRQGLRGSLQDQIHSKAQCNLSRPEAVQDILRCFLRSLPSRSPCSL